ncbi:MAG: GGDEF domain-containing protein [Oscillospiraceae bacterium]|nr:GGDEF domain-containing protein [Oscillospiraceae bacterium]
MNNLNVLNQQCYTIGTVIIDESFHTQSADEEFFRYFGNDVTYSIQRTIHKDDFESFQKTLENLEKGDTEKIVLRMKGISSKFRWFLASVKKTDKQYRITLNDIFSLETLVYDREYLIGEYRHLLSMIHDLAFEYSFETKIIKIYLFDCFREITIINEDLEVWRKKTISKKYIRPEYIEAFNNLCLDIQNGKYRFDYDIESSVFTYGKSFEFNQFKGVTRYNDIQNKKVMGVISVIPSKNKSKDKSTTIISNYDSLSELLNKKSITEYARKIISEKPKYNINIALVDIDNFTLLNNTYGHLFGDEIIYTIANIIKAEIGIRGLAGRISGGGFMIILENTIDETDLRGILRAIRTKTEQVFINRIENLSVTCSIGVSTYPADSDNYDILFMQADKALFIAQEKGKNRYVIYDVNKHGTVETDIENKIVYISNDNGISSHIQYIGTLADRIISNNNPDINSILEEIKTEFNIDCICIFSGENMNDMKAYTKETPNLNASYLFNPKYLEKFNSNGIMIIDNVNELEGRADEAFKILNEQKIFGTIQYLIKKNNEIKGLISYNYIKRFKKWSVTDTNCLTIISHILSSYASEKNII